MNVVHKDKKRFTEKGKRLLHPLDNKLEHLSALEVDERSVYNRLAEVKSFISPDIMVIDFRDDDQSAKTDSQRTHLLDKLAMEWDKTSKEFNMTDEFPGSGMHVVVRLQVTTEIESDATLLHGKPDIENLENSLFIYHRAYIIKIERGSDREGACYNVFLYDCGIFASVRLENVRSMTKEQRLLYSPVYRILHIPGLCPLTNSFVLENLHDKPRHRLMKAKIWSSATFDIANELLVNHGLKVILFAEHGPHIYGDLKIVKYQNEESRTVENDVHDAEKYECYTTDLAKRGLAFVSEDLLRSVLLLDAEDEESNDWIANAKFRKY